jgi:hypothetical protein
LEFHSGREADHSPPSSAEVKEWLEPYLHSPQYAFMAWCSVGRSPMTTLPFYLYPLRMRECFSFQWETNKGI